MHVSLPQSPLVTKLDNIALSIYYDVVLRRIKRFQSPGK